MRYETTICYVNLHVYNMLLYMYIGYDFDTIIVLVIEIIKHWKVTLFISSGSVLRFTCFFLDQQWIALVI